MLKLLQNTLDIIGKISLSTAGYLLKLKHDSYEVIAFTGENRNKFKAFNDELAMLYSREVITAEKISALYSYKKLADELSLYSVFCRPMAVPVNENFTIYLILFSGRKSNYEEKNFKTALGVIDTLAEQVAGKTHEAAGVIDSEKKDVHNLINEEVIESFFSLSEDFIFVLDKNGEVTRINNNGAMLLDYNPSEIVGRHFLDLAGPKGRTVIAQALKTVLKSKNQYRFECTLITKRGKEVQFEVNGKSVLSGGKIAGMIGVARDVTKLHTYETTSQELNFRLMENHRLLEIERARSGQRKAILEELNELKSEFISNISHELRTPLASIIGFSETIASDPEMPSEMKDEFIQVIIQEGKRLAKLINDILDLSKIESGKTDLSMTDIEMISTLKDVIEGYRKQISAKSLQLTCDFPGEEVVVSADKERISKVFYELIGNAIKYTKEGGRITVIVQNLYRELEVIISDTGIGIPEKDIPYIFQKFYRAGRPGAEAQGTGLGLVFVKQIVELHKGLVLVQSEINKGSSFIVKLPKSLKVQKNKV
jgi:PAS domain S-box-containing protein